VPMLTSQLHVQILAFWSSICQLWLGTNERIPRHLLNLFYK
jgi:hypothetical protein